MAGEGASYRRYQGQLQHLRFRFVPIVTSGLRLATKRKLPLVLLLAVPACWTVVFCFNVYTKFALEQGATGREIGSLPITAAARFAARLIDVRTLIDRFFILSRIFALLVTAWFGAGLLADDRRMGAHLLYFSRPLTRLDYLAGKLICVFLFGALVTLVPGLCVCFTAAVSSPDYEWLAKEGDVVWATLAYGVMTAAFFAIFVLAVSSVASRKSYALAGVFGVLMLLHAAGRILSRLHEEAAFRLLSPMSSFHRITASLLSLPPGRNHFPVEWAYGAIGGFTAIGLAVLWWRLRRLEVVG